MNKKLLFLGGTVGNNHWRKPLMVQLMGAGVDSKILFDPVVDNWNSEAQAKEEKAKKEASHLLFYLGDPKQKGNPLPAYSMVEATMALYDKPDTTIVIFDDTGITGQFLDSYKQAEKVLRKRFPKAHIFSNKEDAIKYLTKELS